MIVTTSFCWTSQSTVPSVEPPSTMMISNDVLAPFWRMLSIACSRKGRRLYVPRTSETVGRCEASDTRSPRRMIMAGAPRSCVGFWPILFESGNSRSGDAVDARSAIGCFRTLSTTRASGAPWHSRPRRPVPYRQSIAASGTRACEEWASPMQSDNPEIYYDQDTEVRLLTALLGYLDDKEVIDVGAEHGSFVGALLKAGAAEVYAFEPYPPSVEILRSTFGETPAVH